MSNAGISEAQASRAGLAMLNQAPPERRVEFMQAIMNRALGLYRDGQLDSADLLFETLEAEPLARPRALHLRGVIALQRGEDERALDLLDEAIRLDPTDSDAHANLGLLLLKARQLPQALAAYAAAVTIRPGSAAAQLGLARVLSALDLADFASDTFRDLLAAEPDYVEAIANFGWLLHDTGRYDKGVALLRDALARHPERTELRAVLAICLFGAGDWPAAWAEYDGRLSDPKVSKALLPTDRPRWRGEDLAGRTILLQCEQGYGDIIQFARYAPLIKARGGRVVLRVPSSLLSLMKTVAGVDEAIQIGDGAPAFDVHAPLLSLPAIFDTRPDTIPAIIPYIAADAGLAAQWRARLGSFSGLTIGLVWQGDPAHLNDFRRSVPLDRLQPLIDCPGARFVSLQVGAGMEQLQSYAGQIFDPAAAIDPTSFADTAAIVANLDLVICVDTAIAHLAGAMGKPVWILLAACNDWRWFKEREDAPWYPQARLFRQKQPGDWAEVITRVRAALWSLAGAGDVPQESLIADPVMAAASRMIVSTRVSNNSVLCDALFVDASRHYRMGHFDRAKAIFEHVLSLDPHHVNTLCNLGAMELGLGHGDRAHLLLQTAVALAPSLAPARTGLADVLMATKKTEQAQLQYRKALELAPDSDAVHARYALALFEMGDLDTAMDHFLAATRINQQQPAEFYEALGRTCAARGNMQGAEISLKHALALDPKRAAAHCALGELYLSGARWGDAEASFRSACAIDATLAAALHGLDQLRIALQ